MKAKECAALYYKSNNDQVVFAAVLSSFFAANLLTQTLAQK